GHHGDDPNDGDPPPTDSTFVDFFEPVDFRLPGDTLNCQQEYEEDKTGAIRDYCAAHGLLGRPSSYSDRIDAAVERMRAIGGICATFAATIDSLLARDAIHLSGHFEYSGRSTRSWGGMGAMSVLGRYV